MPVERIRPRNGNVEGGGIDGGRRDALKENKRPKEMLTTRQVANNVECSAQLMHYLSQERCKRTPLHQAKVRNCKVFRAKQPNRIHSNPTQLILTQLYSTHPPTKPLLHTAEQQRSSSYIRTAVQQYLQHSRTAEGGGIDGGRRDALKGNKGPKETLTTQQVDSS